MFRDHSAPDENPERELYRRVRRLALRTMRPVRTHLAGAYAAACHGRGLAFRELRHYEPGDEVRRIDWRTLARFGVPFVKEFVEERDLRVLLVMDVSASMDFRAAHGTKRWTATEAAAALALSAADRGDRVGGLVFPGTGRDVTLIRPARGMRHALRVLRQALGERAGAGATDVRGPLRALERLRRGAVVFLLSDMLFEPPLWDREVQRLLARVAGRHEVVAAVVRDEAECASGRMWSGACGEIIECRDPETGRTVRLAAGDRGLLAALADRDRRIAECIRRAGVARVSLSTALDPVPALRRHFRSVELARRHPSIRPLTRDEAPFDNSSRAWYHHRAVGLHSSRRPGQAVLPALAPGSRCWSKCQEDGEIQEKTDA